MAVAPTDEDEVAWLRVEVVRLRLLVERLTAANQDQARSIAELTGAEPGTAPSVACVYWLYAPTKWGLKSWRHIAMRLRSFVSVFGALGAHEVTPLVWERFVAHERTRTTRLGGPPCDITLNMTLVTVKSMLLWAVRHGMIKRNPLEGVRLAKVKPHRETSISPADLETVLRGAEDELTDGRVSLGDDDGQMCALFTAFALCKFEGMMRFEEVRNMVRGRLATLPDGRGEYSLYGAETKSGQPRTVVFPIRTMEALAAVRPVDGCPYVFASARSGRRLSDGTIRYWFRRVHKRTGIDALAAPGERRVRPHDYRASGATAADLAGARATAIQAALGHASLKTTQKYLRSHKLADRHQVADAVELATGQRKPAQRAGRKRREKLATNR